MFNKIKESTFIPEFAKIKTISTIFKNRGSKLSLQNHRGIFIGSVFSSILMKLIYDKKYEVIDGNMTEFQVGSRKNKNIRNNSWLMNNIVLEAVRKKKNCDLLVLDYKECFDSLHLESITNSLYESGVQDDHLNLIHEANSSHLIKVNTPFGQTEVQEIKKKILQGETFGPLACSNSVDKISKICVEDKRNLYLYRSDSEDPVEIAPLGMVDDIIAVSECGVDSVKMCSYLNTQTNIMKLQFGASKCHKLHVGNDKTLCPDLFLDNWKLEPKTTVMTSVWDREDTEDNAAVVEEVSEDSYLGELVSSNSKIDKNIEKRVSRGISAGNAIIEILNETVFGNYDFEVFVVLRNSLLLSTLISNGESWNNIMTKHIQDLEQTDERIMCKKFELHPKTSRTFLYLETGTMPVRYLLMRRRLMYLQYLLQQGPESVLFKCLKAMMKSTLRGDWLELVTKDLKDLDIKLSYEEIEKFSKEDLKELVKEQTEIKAFGHLMGIKEKQTKMRDLEYKKLEPAEYLKPESNLRRSEVNSILTLRSSMLDIPENFKSSSDPNRDKCLLCKDQNLTQEHLLVCKELNANSISNTEKSLEYKDLFTNKTEKIKEITEIIFRNFNKYKLLIQSGPTTDRDSRCRTTGPGS